jgi:hypothetical protein
MKQQLKYKTSNLIEPPVEVHKEPSLSSHEVPPLGDGDGSISSNDSFQSMSIHRKRYKNILTTKESIVKEIDKHSHYIQVSALREILSRLEAKKHLEGGKWSI